MVKVGICQCKSSELNIAITLMEGYKNLRRHSRVAGCMTSVTWDDNPKDEPKGEPGTLKARDFLRDLHIRYSWIIGNITDNVMKCPPSK